MVQSAQSNEFPQGQCTWWASQRYWQLTGDYVPWSGNAYEWAGNAPQFGWSVSSSPQTGDIVCFQPGVQKADSVYGHVAIVESISGNSIYTSNLNFDGNQTTITDATFQTGSGVSFINNGQGGVNTNPIPASGTPATEATKSGNGTQSGQSQTINGTSGDTAVTLQQFCVAVLNRLKNDKGVTNITGTAQHTTNFMIAWAMQESGETIKNGHMCSWNPFNTTLQVNDATYGNSKVCGQTLGVQAYPDQGMGETATAHTLEGNRGYSALWNALATDDENGLGFGNTGMATNVAQGLAIWVNGKPDLARANSYILSIMANAGIKGGYIVDFSKSNSSIQPASQSQIDKWGSQIIGYYASGSSALNDLGLTGVAQALQNLSSSLAGVGTFFQGLSDLMKDPVRIFKVLAGAVLTIAGIVLFINAMAAPTVQKVAKVAAL